MSELEDCERLRAASQELRDAEDAYLDADSATVRAIFEAMDGKRGEGVRLAYERANRAWVAFRAALEGK